jgi:hypothetical protein
MSRQAAVPGPDLGEGDGCGRCIDSGGLQSEARGHQRVFPGSAPNIQDTAPEGARFGQRQERGLGRPMYHGGVPV